MNTVDSLGFYDRSHNELKQHRQWRFSTEGRNYRKHTTDFKHEFSERCSTAFSVTLPKLIAEDKFSSRQVYHLWPITHFELGAISNLHAFFIPLLIGLCSYKNVLTIWGHSRWKLTLTEIVSLRAFSFVLTAILNSQAGCRCTLVPRLPFPVPRSPFPVPGISNIQLFTQTGRSVTNRNSFDELQCNAPYSD